MPIHSNAVDKQEYLELRETVPSSTTDRLYANSAGRLFYDGNKVLFETQQYTTLTSAATVNIDWSLGNVFFITMAHNVTFTFTNLPGSGLTQEVVLYLLQDNIGSRTVAFPSSVKWASNATPPYNVLANKYDVIVLRKVNALTNTTGVYIGGGWDI